MSTFKAIWPITNPALTLDRLTAAAQHDVPVLAAQAHARLTSRGRFTIARSVDVPGSGRATATVLVYEARAVELPHRPYWAPEQQEAS